VVSLGNEVTSGFPRDLLSRSSLMVSVYANPAEAQRLSAEHFRHVEQRLKLKRQEDGKMDVTLLFSEISRG